MRVTSTARPRASWTLTSPASISSTALPLISSGGSSVLMTCVAMGLLLRVSYELKRAERRQAVRIGGAEDAAAEPMALVDGEAFLASGVRQQRRTGGSRAERKGKR